MANALFSAVPLLFDSVRHVISANRCRRAARTREAALRAKSVPSADSDAAPSARVRDSRYAYVDDAHVIHDFARAQYASVQRATRVRRADCL